MMQTLASRIAPHHPAAVRAQAGASSGRACIGGRGGIILRTAVLSCVRRVSSRGVAPVAAAARPGPPRAVSPSSVAEQPLSDTVYENTGQLQVRSRLLSKRGVKPRRLLCMVTASRPHAYRWASRGRTRTCRARRR